MAHRRTAALIAAAAAAVVGGVVVPPGHAATEGLPTYALWVDVGGEGLGTVTSDPAGIDCGPDADACWAEFDEGAQVSLTATAGPLSTFVGWAGACTGAEPTCVVTMADEAEVEAVFDALVLDAELAGDGFGSVVSDPAGIDCGGEESDCSERYAPGTEVTLVATAGEDSVFLGWDGACTGTGTCVVTMDDDAEVTAEFDTMWLEVEPIGDGRGTVTSDPVAIDCGYATYDCRESYLPGAVVTLSADPDDTAGFAGWSGDCAGLGDCTVVMDADRTAHASFDTAFVHLSLAGDGSGTVQADDGELTCPGDCFRSYLPGTEITLSVAPKSTSVFTGWTGDCTGLETTCDLVLDDDVQVEAGFDTGRVFVGLGGDGTGTVTSHPAGVACPGDCWGTFLPGTQVTLVAAATGGYSVFTGWTGDCSGTGACVVDAGDDPSVGATFDTARLWVDRLGGGFGTVISEPAGIDCGADCFERYLPGSTVTLTATAHGGSTFAGWSGDCTGREVCVIELSGERNVNAWFNPPGTAGKIAYECNYDICVMNEDGSEQTNLTNTPDDQEYAPSLSADGTKVVFMSTADLTHNPDGNLEIATMNVDGSGLTQVTSTDVWEHHAYDPDWSPDGTKIVFAAKRPSAPQWQQLFVVNADGTGEAMLTEYEFGVARHNPQWSPDGTKISYTWVNSTQDLHVINADGTGDVNISPTTDFADDRGAAWSPDGSRIAFTTTRFAVNTDIHVSNADGSNHVVATNHAAIDESPTWSPDGLWIAFSSTRSGSSYDIWAVLAPPADGRAGVPDDGAVRLTDTPGPELEPYWAGDEAGQVTHQVKIKKTGKGKGQVTSSPQGIRCGRDCVETFAAGSRVVLTATAAPGSVLAGWSLPCPVTNACTVSVDQARTVSVRFDRTKLSGFSGPLNRRPPQAVIESIDPS